MKFILEICYSIFFALLAIIIFARWIIIRKVVHQKVKKNNFNSDHKLDMLQIKDEGLICYF